MSYSAVKQSHPPTGVTRGRACSLTERGAPNLVVAKNNVLAVYLLRVDSEPTVENEVSYANLEQVHESSIHGTVRQLEVVRPAGSATDWLLLTFNDAQLAFVAWDPLCFEFATKAIRNYEDSQLLYGRSRLVPPPMLRVDPEQRCAAFLYLGYLLRIIPMENFDTESDGSATEFTINLEEIGVRHVKDFAFLDGNLEPTVTILYEYSGTWTGRLKSAQATCSVRTLSLSLPAKTHTDIWSESDLPYNCFRLVPVAHPVGGTLLLSTNTLWYLNSSTRVAVAVNEFGLDDLTASHINGALGSPNDLSDAAISLNACCATFLTPNRALLNLHRGEMYCVELLTEVSEVVGFAINRDGQNVLASCACKLSNQFVFLGSRLGDSTLIEYNEYKETDNPDVSDAEAVAINVQNIAPNVKEQLQSILMELRISLDKATSKEEACKALAQFTPQIESFLLEHGSGTYLSKFCTQMLERCGWDLSSNAWREGAEIKAECASASDVSGDGAAFAIPGAPGAAGDDLFAGGDAAPKASEPEDESACDAAAVGGWDASEAKAALDEGVGKLTSSNKRRKVGRDADFEDDLFGESVGRRESSALVASSQSAIELSIMRSGRSHLKNTRTFTYKVRDTMHNIGPLVDCVFGNSSAESTTPGNSSGPRLHQDELVTCSGYGKFTSVMVLNRDVRPEVVHSIDLNDLDLSCRAIWGVRHNETQQKWSAEAEEGSAEVADEDEHDDSRYHAFVVASLQNNPDFGTMVLEATRNGLNSMDSDDTGFVLDEQTVLAGNVAEDRYIVQVCRTRVVVLNEQLKGATYQVEQPDASELIETVFVESATIADPYVVLRTSDSRLVFLKVNSETAQIEHKNVDLGAADILSVALFSDMDSLWTHSWTTAGSGASIPEQPAEIAVKPENAAATAVLKTEASEPAEADSVASLFGGGDDAEDDIFGEAAPKRETEKSALQIATVDDDDIFGDSAGGQGASAATTAAAASAAAATASEEETAPVETVYFVLVGRSGGRLEIYRVADEEELFEVRLVFVSDRVTQGRKAVLDERTCSAEPTTVRGMASPLGARGAGSPTVPKAAGADAPLISRQASSRQAIEIVEVHMHVLDENGTRPVMAVVLTTGEVLLYRAFSFLSTSGLASPDNPQPFGFNILPHGHVFAPTKAEREVVQPSGASAEGAAKLHTLRVVPFVGVGNLPIYPWSYNGYFIGGERPAWVFCDHEAVRVHPMLSEGSIVSFAPFHNIHCPQGYVELTSQNVLKVCRLPEEVQYGGPWPYRKVPLKDASSWYTAHKIAYHSQSRTYAVLASRSVEAEKPMPDDDIDEDGVINMQAKQEGPEAKRLPRYAEQYEVRILSPKHDWSVVTKFELEPDENGLALETLQLEDQGGRKACIIAVGTGWVCGEARTCKGRLILLEIEDQISGPQISVHLTKEEKGPVSAVSQVMKQFIVASAGTGIDPTHRGTTMLVHKWQIADSIPKLEIAAFHHCHLFITTLSTIRGTGIIIFGDINKSCHCLMFHHNKKLDLIARDYWPLQVTAAHFALDGSKQLSLVVTDAKQNIQILTLPKGTQANDKMKKLQPSAQFHLGTTVQKLVLRDLTEQSGVSTKTSKRLSMLYVGLDGSIGACMQISDSLSWPRPHFKYAPRCTVWAAACTCRLYRAAGRAHISPTGISSAEVNSLVLSPYCSRAGHVMLKLRLSRRWYSLGVGGMLTAGLNPKAFRVFRPSTLYFSHERCASHRLCSLLPLRLRLSAPVWASVSRLNQFGAMHE
eukprot:SAG11_NODE_633_length_8047_cov_33.422874_1_plen_1762_part_00